MGSTSSKEKTVDVPFTPTQLATIKIQGDISDANLQEIIRQRALVISENTQLEQDLGVDFGDEFSARSSDIEDLRDVRQRVLDVGLQDQQRGGRISPEELLRLSVAESSATDAGSLRGERDLQSKLALINDRLNIGSQRVSADPSFLAERSSLNDQLLRSSTAAQFAQDRITSPLQTSAATQQGVAGLASGQENALQAQFQMQQNAINNRLQLVGGQVSAGNALTRATVPNFTGLDRKTSTKGSTSGFQLLSSRELKHNNSALDSKEILESVNSMGPEVIENGCLFEETFKVGDGATVALVDVIGVMTASIQALSRKIVSLELNSDNL